MGPTNPRRLCVNALEGVLTRPGSAGEPRIVLCLKRKRNRLLRETRRIDNTVATVTGGVRRAAERETEPAAAPAPRRPVSIFILRSKEYV